MALGRLALAAGAAGAGVWAGWLLSGWPAHSPQAVGWFGTPGPPPAPPDGGGLAVLIAGAVVVAVMNGYSKAYSP